MSFSAMRGNIRRLSPSHGGELDVFLPVGGRKTLNNPFRNTGYFYKKSSAKEGDFLILPESSRGEVYSDANFSNENPKYPVLFFFPPHRDQMRNIHTFPGLVPVWREEK